MSQGTRSFLIIAYFGIFVFLTLGLASRWVRSGQPPDQPIHFPHFIHVSRIGLPCNFCHLYVEKAKRAGVPSISRCMSCHQSVAVEKPEIKKLTRFYREKQPIRWIRIYSIPSFVYFSHKRHIKAQVDCSACHGAVGGMKKIRKVRSLKMGFCVNCHRDRGAPLDCATCHQ